MQTAVEKLKSEIQRMQEQCENDWQCGYQNALNEVLYLIEQAKQMEKEQISKAWDDGNYQYFCSVRTNEDFDNGYEYYEEQYKSE